MEDVNPRTLPLDPNIKLTKTSLDELHTVVPESVFPYMKVVGTLLHLVNCTRPDLAHAVGMLCRFNHAPGPTHVAAAKSVMRYLRGTKHRGVSYPTTSTPFRVSVTLTMLEMWMAGNPLLGGSGPRMGGPFHVNQSCRM